MRRRKAGRREEIEEERESIAAVYPYSSSDIGVCSYLSNKALRSPPPCGSRVAEHPLRSLGDGWSQGCLGIVISTTTSSHASLPVKDQRQKDFDVFPCD
ncbi:hypothetical protein ALC57_17879 [Trachymyrmex cornetzi]|uniref:Uncharacterized protein n=1 Tax=Trachymyrmex cornetzi TaxID=471704 RepID=A0A151IST1_9HYME|nr:hypothetical protein ALC57_17879 [Trachymyrmex cornetzi]